GLVGGTGVVVDRALHVPAGVSVVVDDVPQKAQGDREAAGAVQVSGARLLDGAEPLGAAQALGALLVRSQVHRAGRLVPTDRDVLGDLVGVHGGLVGPLAPVDG